MRLLIFTQKIDRNDPILGFFHGWVEKLAVKADTIEVICLQKGDFDLPSNVTVYSLGKEEGVSKLRYILNLYSYLSLIAHSYDKVFIHMNQEYVLLAGLYWKLQGIPVYLWRNHPTGSVLTRIAVALSTKVFCTSKDSFTARFSKTVIMPVGIDTDVFRPKESGGRKKYSICMIGRISPIKHIELGLAAVKNLCTAGVQVSLSIIGSAPAKDKGYYEFLKKYVVENNLSSSIHFLEEVPPYKTPEVFSEYEICLNLTETGSFDKTIVEAAACGVAPLVSNTSLVELLPEVCLTKPLPETIAVSIQCLFEPKVRLEIQSELVNFVSSQSLAALMEKLIGEIE